MYDHELSEMREQLQDAKRYGISTIIASDQFVLQYDRDLNQEVLLFTQLNIGNIESVRFYTNFADVMVLAGELNLNQVRDITNGIR